MEIEADEAAEPAGLSSANVEAEVGGEADDERVAIGSKEALIREAHSAEHMLDHRDHNPYCDICLGMRAQRRHRRKGQMLLGPKPADFGDQVTGDHLINREGNGEGDDFFPAATTAVVMLDRATKFLDCYPKATKSLEDTLAAFRHFQGPAKKGRARVRQFYGDNAGELLGAAQKLGWAFKSSTPGCPQTNGLAERCVRKVKEGGRGNLIQSGLSPTWWSYATSHHCFARNIKVVDGDSAYHKRHKTGHCKALQIPFGCGVQFMPTRRKNIKVGFDNKLQYGLFVGYFVQPGGVWSGDYLVVDFSVLSTKPNAAPSECKTYRTSEVYGFDPNAMKFPLAEWNRKQQRTVASDGTANVVSPDGQVEPITTVAPVDDSCAGAAGPDGEDQTLPYPGRSLSSTSKTAKVVTEATSQTAKVVSEGLTYPRPDMRGKGGDVSELTGLPIRT